MYVQSLRQFGGKVREIFDVSDWGVCPMFGLGIVCFCTIFFMTLIIQFIIIIQ